MVARGPSYLAGYTLRAPFKIFVIALMFIEIGAHRFE